MPRVRENKSSFLEEATQSIYNSFLKPDKPSKSNQTSSVTTIFAIVNLMVGSIVLLLPVNFGTSGLVLSLIIMSLVGAISYTTCRWLVYNSIDSDSTVDEVLERILGIRWSKVQSCTSSILLFNVAIIYFLLINQTFWQMLQYIFYYSGVDNSQLGSPSEIVFDKFSVQWLAIILMPVLFPLCMIKKPVFIIKIAGYGAIALYVYIAFIFYIFFQNVYVDNITSQNLKEIQLFSSDFKIIGTIIGNFAIAFMPHNCITNIMSTNKNKSNNPRDLRIAFIIVFLVYAGIGVFGVLGLIGKAPVDLTKTPEIIYDFFQSNDIVAFLVELVFLCNLITVFPLVAFISKAQFFKLFYVHEDDIPYNYLMIFNIVLSNACMIIQIFLVNVNYVIGIAGNAVGFLVVYFIPTLLKFKVKYGFDLFEADKQLNKESIKEQLKTQIYDQQESLHENSNDQTDFTYTDKNNNYNNDNSIRESLINSEYQNHINKKFPKKTGKDYAYITWVGFLNLIGLTFAVISLVIIFIPGND